MLKLLKCLNYLHVKVSFLIVCIVKKIWTYAFAKYFAEFALCIDNQAVKYVIILLINISISLTLGSDLFIFY